MPSEANTEISNKTPFISVTLLPVSCSYALPSWIQILRSKLIILHSIIVIPRLIFWMKGWMWTPLFEVVCDTMELKARLGLPLSQCTPFLRYCNLECKMHSQVSFSKVCNLAHFWRSNKRVICQFFNAEQRLVARNVGVKRNTPSHFSVLIINSRIRLCNPCPAVVMHDRFGAKSVIHLGKANQLRFYAH